MNSFLTQATRALTMLLSAAMFVLLASCGGDNTTVSETSSQSENESDNSITSEAKHMKWKDIDGDGIISIACVGDSITIGNENSNYPAFLQEYLNFFATADEYDYTYEVKNFGKGGAAVHHQPGSDGVYFWYDSDEYKNSKAYKADIVLVQFGTNDAGNIDILDTYFKNDLLFLIQPYLDNGSTVIMATPTTASNGSHDFAVNGKISELVREFANERQLQLVDLNLLTKDREESFPDGLHGNNSGYSLIAQLYYNRVFGGKLLDVTFETEPGATVSYDIHMATADADGIAKLTLCDYIASRNYNVVISCDGYKTIVDSAIINASSTFKYPMTPGGYAIRGAFMATADASYGSNTADFAVDGDLSTRWESEYKDNTWLLVDMGAIHKINGVKIVWEGAYASQYDIEVSTDGTTFTTVASVELAREGLVATPFDDIDARFIKVLCNKRGTKYGSSIKEIYVLSDEQ